MILEGFEISNWSCIKHVHVTDLPPTGVIVLHGPNGTGKSSIIEALRACLMDNKSTSKAVERGFSKNSSEKPRVSVAFQANGTSWKITKQFNSKESKLESRTPAGQWKLETADPTEAHDRARELTGGSASSLGLHQLLWLTQAEFHLPDPKKFDEGVQSRLRAVLGVLQTPLDDRFLDRVKQGWAKYFDARSKRGEKPKLKKDCLLDKMRATLDQYQAELTQIEGEYRTFEDKVEKCGDLEIQVRDLRYQLKEKADARDALQREYEQSLERIKSHRLAAGVLSSAEKTLTDALALRKRRTNAEQEIADLQRQAGIAARRAEDMERNLHDAEQALRVLRGNAQDLRAEGRTIQSRINEADERAKLLSLIERVNAAREKLKLVEDTARRLEELKNQARERPAPDETTLKKLEDNRAKAARLRADLEAGAIVLKLAPEVGAAIPRISIDRELDAEVAFPSNGTPLSRLIRRTAEIAIPGWGHAEITRGSDSRSFDEIENELVSMDRTFGELLAPFGVVAGDSEALDLARTLAAEKKLRDAESESLKEELTRLAPKGHDSLREQVSRLVNQLKASEANRDSQSEIAQLPSEMEELEKLVFDLREELQDNESAVAELEGHSDRLMRQIEGDPDAQNGDASGLRAREASAKEQFTTLNATVDVHRAGLERLLTAEQIERAIQEAETAVTEARKQLESMKLSEGEESIQERLDTAKEAWRVIDKLLSQVEKEFHQIEGELRGSEGFHPKRAAATARVEELTRQTERETLESEAYDRLYALFEECREKRLESVMGPIQGRVLRWMRLLRIGGSIHFNDQFLPDKLTVRDGLAELLLADESVGTIEQIALMVRLALGSVLSTPKEPVAAVLDDPLTHSDVVRLDRMRAVLKSAAAGDAGTVPPAGPVQIVVFTCHPEWFAIDGAKLVDLGSPEVLSRF